MASWMVHLRIAEKLLSHLIKPDETAFIIGGMAPDSGVPNADWTEFHPPKSVSHFQTKTENGHFIDLAAFRERYFSRPLIDAYSPRQFFFFLGYYVHLLTDVRWSEAVYAPILEEHRNAYRENRRELLRAVKEDWYDLDFLFLEQHPDFRAFSIYENAVGFENDLMDLFGRDAFDDRRRYICSFYRSEEHGVLHREYPFLTPEKADAFVNDTSKWILEQIKDFIAL